MARIERLFDNDDRDSWGRASRAINKDIGNLDIDDRVVILGELYLINMFDRYIEKPEDDNRFADYILSLDFAFVKHTNSEPRTYKHL